MWKLFVLVLTLHFYRETYRITALYGPRLSIGLGALHMMPQDQWCRVCTKILPAFCKLSNEFKNLMFVYADIDECPETTQSIRYTPTFHFYRDGERVDEMLGAGEERLHDRLWLHS
ncbi:thioredoxin-like 3-3 isoform X2 [Musa acuminata AAA Group]|uniref:thioredoxin-like 3-3 isoform X2 n=1 Tax=Musa acuminata AAA Group TaxID=214697 RepID=UPI0031CE811A